MFWEEVVVKYGEETAKRMGESSSGHMILWRSGKMGEDPEIKRTLLDTEVFEDKGYEIRTEKWEMEGNPSATVETGYTYPGGDLIGNRVIHGFGIGDEVKEGDLTATSGWSPEYLREHPDDDYSLPVGFKAETLDDTRRMAIALAKAVS